MADITHGTWIKDGKISNGENLLINTTGSIVPTISTTPYAQIDGRVSQSVDGITTVTKDNVGDGEFYYRPMPPDTQNLYGLVPGETYNFSGQILSSNSSATISMRAQESTKGSWDADIPLISLPVNTSFQPFSIKFTVPANSTGFYFSIQEYNFSTGDSFSFKQLKLENIVNPIDAVYQDGKQVYGRNLLLDTGFNDLPKYWAARDGKVTGTFNGNNVIYYDATKLTSTSVDVLYQPIYDPALTTNRVLPNQWYTLSFYTKGVGTIYGFVFPNFVDTSSYSYIDGVKLEYSTPDGSKNWNLTDDWIRHTYTFKSKSSFPATGTQGVLWRLFKGNEVYITMPKFEAGTLATPWSQAPEDVLK